MLAFLKCLIAAQPDAADWKFLTARLTAETGDSDSTRDYYKEVLIVNPLSFEALFENALPMDQCGEGEAAMRRLEEALHMAAEEKMVKEVRDVKLIMVQIMFLQKNVDEALMIYNQLTKEDPRDFRPYFCRGMIYILLDRNEEVKTLATVDFEDSNRVLIRPHPAIWRLVHGMVVAYLVALTFLLFQQSDSRATLMARSYLPSKVFVAEKRSQSKLKHMEMECEYLKRWFGSLTVEQNRRPTHRDLPSLLRAAPSSTLSMCPRYEHVTSTADKPLAAAAI
ncbi:protein SLOW GREEN 1, chloroplastic [Glycine soja]|uniref:CDP-diacylglycerol--serine O-phosphatidyltransferase n=1 Tax=Glycine soja TaxID=3848 RepID=A0A445GG31_GLYSO|nr:protein SLOW GREEN 1, chloroplastic [Glycine soja]